MILKKEYSEKEQLCRIVFGVTNDWSLDAQNVRIVGEFNNWDRNTEPMAQTAEGDFVQELELKTNQEYQFRYLVDDYFWENEPQADGLTPSGVDVEDYNSVLVI
ncbi:isoamylase early set domain-containing protein [Mangrovibacterium marinum]|uniref:AMP-activated protein kinase-like protein n=1 Tax=Mangrovibacterium marinum TaxID=1639118 RepID=A0A2T5C258_9BACT|nr:isoamylase early set domain-containing protein [Mangrovibacterium marinum]PTN08779.1 AMP-activated protein kinase-like protein [Mangrovibacterium marinum]